MDGDGHARGNWLGNVQVQLEECFDRLLKKKPYLILPLYILHITPGGRERHCVHIMVRQTWGKKLSVVHASFPIIPISHLRKRPAEIRQHTLFWIGLNRYVLTPVLFSPNVYSSITSGNGGGIRLCGLGGLGTARPTSLHWWCFLHQSQSVQVLIGRLTRSDRPCQLTLPLYLSLEFFLSFFSSLSCENGVSDQKKAGSVKEE